MICRLSSEFAIGMIFSFAHCMVHSPVGTNLSAARSQLKMSDGGISLFSTSALMSARNSSGSSSKCVTMILPAFEYLLLIYPILRNSDFAHAFIILM